MKGKLLSVLMVAMFVVALVPTALAATPISVGVGIGGIDISTQQFAPRVFMDPDTRILLHNNADGNVELVERQGNYAFEGEQMVWDVVVWDENGIESVTHVDGVVGDVEDMTADDDVEVECIGNGRTDSPYDYTDARDQSGQPLLFDSSTMRWYTCTLTVETPESDDFYGEKFLSIRAEDQDGLMGLITE